MSYVRPSKKIFSLLGLSQDWEDGRKQFWDLFRETKKVIPGNENVTETSIKKYNDAKTFYNRIPTKEEFKDFDLSRAENQRRFEEDIKNIPMDNKIHTIVVYDRKLDSFLEDEPIIIREHVAKRLKEIKNASFSVTVEYEKDGKDKTKYGSISKSDFVDNVIKNLTNVISDQYEYTNINKISINIFKRQNKLPDYMRDGQTKLICFEQAIIESIRRHKKIEKYFMEQHSKEGHEYYTIEKVIEFADKFNIHIIILDGSDIPWFEYGTGDKKVFLTYNNFHVTKADSKARKSATFYLNNKDHFEIKDGLIMPQIKNIGVSNDEKRAKGNVKIISHDEFIRKYEALTNNNAKFKIKTKNSEVIGLQIKDKRYASDKFIFPIRDFDGPYYTSESRLFGMFKKYICHRYVDGTPERSNIYEPALYQEMRKQKQFHFIYKHYYKAQPGEKIYQIDQVRAYTNAAIDPKNRYPCADFELVYDPNEIDNKNASFAFISYDQSHISIKMFFDGTNLDKNTVLLPIPAVRYMLKHGAKIDIHFILLSSFYEENPFTDFYELVKSSYPKLNSLVGCLNMKQQANKSFSTFCVRSHNRFMKLVDKMDYKIVSMRKREYEPSEFVKKHINPSKYLDAIYEYSYIDNVVPVPDNMCHLSAYIQCYQKISLYEKIKSLKLKLDNLIYINTDSIVFSSKKTLKPDPTFKFEFSCDEVYNPVYGIKVLLSDGEVINRKGPKAVDFKKLQHKPKDFKPNESTLGSAAMLINSHTRMDNGQCLAYISAKAGTGKSEYIKFLTGKKSKMESLRHSELEPIIGSNILLCATTHVARKLVKCSLTLRGVISKLKSAQIDFDSIIIDEAFMMSCLDIAQLDYWLRKKYKNLLFGGKNILLVGDEKQLPCVDGKPVILSPFMKYFKKLQLTQVYRQKSPQYINVLDRIRSIYEYGGDDYGNLPFGYFINYFPELAKRREQCNKNKLEDTCGSEIVYFPLFRSNIKVEEYNNEISNGLEYEEQLKQLYRCRKNFNKLDVYNGDIVKLVEKKTVFAEDDCWLEFIIENEEGTRISVPPEFFETKEGEKHPIIQKTHASTIHLAQGRTMEAIKINLNEQTVNQAYVSLSRVSDFEFIDVYFTDDKYDVDRLKFVVENPEKFNISKARHEILTKKLQNVKAALKRLDIYLI